MQHLINLFVISSLLTLNLYTDKSSEKNPLIEKIITEISSSNINALVNKLVGFESRHSLSDTTSNTRGIGSARRWIKSEFESYIKDSQGRMKVEYHETIVPPSARVPNPTKIVNVIATLYPPTITTIDPSHRILIVSAHYDSRASNPLDSESLAPGANDDGSGTAVVLELARVFSRYAFEVPIIFITFAGEEQGLLGSKQFTEMTKNRNWNIEAVFNNDIVGNIRGGDGNIESTYVRVFSEAYPPSDTGSIFRQRNTLGLENDGASRSLARYIKEIGERYVPHFTVKMIYRRDRFLRGGDHSPFHENGYAAVRFTEAKEHFNHQHQDVRTENNIEYGDLPRFMNYEYCTNVARINAAVIASLALAPAAPANVRIVTKGLDYNTILLWNMNQEKDIAGYRVRYRETSSPVWQHATFTSDTTITIDESKDDYLFGVQAVDKSGNASLVSIPLPSR